MKKKLPFLSALAILWALMVFSPPLSAQCGLGETGYNLVLTGGNFDQESSWEIYPAPESGPSGQACGSFVPGQYAICLNNNSNYTFTAYDDYGDGWNGGTVTISQSGANCVILPTTEPTNNLSGDMNWSCISSDTEFSISWMAGPGANCENPPTNDECNNAILLTHTGNALLTPATAAHSTQSLGTITCDNYTASEPLRDVWFCFSATAASANILVSDPANPNLSAFDAVIELFDGCNGNSLACEDISSPEILGATELTPGHTYCFRVYPYSSTEDNLDFGVAVYGGSGGCSGPADCNDNDPCTLDSCDGNACAHIFLDADGDNTCDAQDGCPNDPNKTSPGNCGCGNAEPGTTCNDGNPETYGDSIQANCICAGNDTPPVMGSSFEKIYSTIPNPGWFVNQRIAHIEESSQGGYYGCGGFNPAVNFGGIAKILLWRMANNGDTLWTKKLANADSTSWAPVDGANTPDGGMYILYIRYLPGTTHNGVIKVDADGNILWNTHISSTATYATGWYQKIITDTDGGCVVAGANNESGPVPTVIKLSEAGDIVWSNSNFTSQQGYNRFSNIAKAPDEGYFVTGKVHHNFLPDSGGRNRMLVARLNSSGGNVWEQVLNGGSFIDGDSIKSEGYGIVATPDNGCIAVGYQTDPASWNTGAFLIRFDSLGNTVWTKKYFYDIAQDARAYSIFPTSDGHYLFFASTIDGVTSDEPRLVKINLQGDTLWTQRGYYRYFGYNVQPVSLTTDDQVLMTGASSPDANYGIFIRTTTSGIFRAPLLYLPWHLQENVVLDPLLILNTTSPIYSIHDYRRFRYQVATDSSFNSIIIDMDNIANDSLQISGLSPNSTYYWRALGYGADATTTPWSAPWKFFTGNYSYNENLATPGPTLLIYPNPATDVATIHLEVYKPGAAQLQVIDLTGRVVYHSSLACTNAGGYDVLLDTQALPQGLYYISLHSDARTSIVQKLMINK